MRWTLLAAPFDPKVRPLDLKRMFIGDEPPLFLVEIAVRSAIIFGFTLFALRFLGKRGVAQLSLVEVTIILGLGSAVGDPMFQADVPLSHALVVISAIVFMYRGFTALVRRSEWFERLMEGQTRCLVADGVVQIPQLERDRLSREKLFELLRIKGVAHLGEVRQAYLEQSGELSVFTAAPLDVRPGLPIVPPWDIEPPALVEADAAATSVQPLACCHCGTLLPPLVGQRSRACATCGGKRWTLAKAPEEATTREPDT